MLVKFNRTTIARNSGAVVTGATVSFYTQSDGVPAPTFADPDGQIPLGNAVVSNSVGRVSVFIKAGIYRITIAKDGVILDELTYEPVVSELASLRDPSTAVMDLARSLPPAANAFPMINNTGALILNNATQARSEIGLGNVNNTSDSAKPVSTAQQTAINARIPLTQKGAAGGVATLDATGLVPISQLPGSLEDVLEFPNLAALPQPGETGKIYVLTDNNWQYRWSGTAYIRLVASPGSSDEVPEGTVNRYFTDARVRATGLDGYTVGANTAIAATDSIFDALRKAQGQIAARQATITGSASTIVSTNLTANRVMVLSASSKAAASGITVTELDRLSGVTENIQLQLNGRALVATQIGAGAGLTGGGDLSTSRTLSVVFGTTAGTVAEGSALALKVDKVTGKQLSTEDYTTAEQTKLAGVQAGAQANVATNLSATAAASAVTVSSSTGSNATLPAATGSAAGVMVAADKTKLDGIQSGAQANVATNLSVTTTATTVTVVSSTGSNATLPAATTAAAGVLTAADKAKINALGTAANADLTTSATDNTAGRVLQVGDHGLGGTGARGAWTHPTNGTREFILSDVDAPTAEQHFGLNVRSSPNFGLQMAARDNFYWRFGFGASVPPWKKIWDNSNLASPYEARAQSTQDLNTLIIPDFYFVGQPSPNNPIQRAGLLRVNTGFTGVEVNNRVSQEFHCDNGSNAGRKFSRVSTDAGATWSEWAEEWNSNNLVKTASSTDTTAGRMLQVGDFGLGSSFAPVLNSAALVNAAISTGKYWISGVSGMPLQSFGVLDVLGGVSNRAIQKWYPMHSSYTTQREFTRFSNDGGVNWSAWAEDWSTNNLQKSEFATAAQGAKADAALQIFPQITGPDWNTITTPGFHIINAAGGSNGPAPLNSAVWHLTVSGGPAGVVTQTATGTGNYSDHMLFRSLSNGFWSFWTRYRPFHEYVENRVLVSTTTGDIGVSGTTVAELGYVSGVTGPIQAQIDASKLLAQNIRNANYTFALADNSNHVYHNNATAYTWTIPANSAVAFPIGATITMINDGTGLITVALQSGATAFMAGQGETTGFGLLRHGVITATKVGANRWMFSGVGRA